MRVRRTQAGNFCGRSAGWVQKCAVQLLHALAHLRLHRVVHADIKPENVLLASMEDAEAGRVDVRLAGMVRVGASGVPAD